MATSMDLIKKRIADFIYSKSNDCLAIKGKWGTGKTYLWNRIISELNVDQMQFNYYSYASLFGMNSLQQIKLAIAASKVKKMKIKNRDGLIKKTSIFATKHTAKIVKIINERWNGIGDIAEIISEAIFFNITNTLICIDDFDRKDSKLTTTEILGLISNLKEQRNCKVVLIFNEENLVDNEKNVYNQFREKIIDKEIFFNPSAEDCSSIVFGSEEYSEILVDFSCQLEINNIRILFHIKKLALDLLSILNEYSAELRKSALHSLVLFTYIFYSHDTRFPDFDSLREISLHDSSYTEENEDNSLDEWKNNLLAYSYLNTDDFDLVIHDGVKHGYFDEQLMIEEANILDAHFKSNKSNEAIKKVWDIYNSSFDTNENELIVAIEQSIRSHFNNISTDNLNSFIIILRVLGRNQLADELIDFYVQKRSNEAELFDLSRKLRNMPPGFIIDKKIKKDFEAKCKVSKKIKSLNEVLEKIANTSSFTEEDKKVFENATVEEFYRIFKSESNDSLNKLIQGGFIAIPEKTREALKLIGKENPLNALKVKQYGIIIE